MLPNLLLSTLALVAPAALPPGQQSSAVEVSAPIATQPPLNDQYVNTLIFGIKGAQIFSQTDWPSAPAVKYQPKVDVYPNLILSTFSTATITVQPIGKHSSAVELAAPSVKYQLRIDPIPNLLETTLLPTGPKPFPSPLFLPVPSIPQAETADMYVVSYLSTVAPTTGIKSPIFMQTPAIKRPVIVEVIENTLIHGIPAPIGTPVGIIQNTSALQTKYAVYDTNAETPNVLVRGFPATVPMPFQNYDTSQIQKKFEVYDVNLLWPNSQLPNTIPPTPPTPPSVGGGTTRPGGRVILEPKKQGETIPENFDFISKLAPSETIFTATCTCTVYSGEDPNASSMVDGAATISGTVATQEVTAGVVGVIYELLMTVVTSLGNVIEMAGYLAIEPDLQ